MKSLLTRLLVGVVLVAAIVAVAAWLVLRASLPTLDGELAVEGLAGPASIVRDAEGIATISAGNRDDLAFATGFAHGQDRFFQMDLMRRQAAGELSALFGSAALETDRRHRFHRFRQRAEAAMSRWTEADVDLLERYAAGVNAGIESLGARPFEYLLLGATPEPWRPQDSVLVVYALYMQLNDARARRDTRRGFAFRSLPAEVYAWLYPEGTSWDAPIMGEKRSAPAAPSADVFSLRDNFDAAPPAGEKGKPYLNGSNNWVVSGALTSTGRALMSNDMHLGHRVPNLWYQARLIVDGEQVNGEQARDVTGVSLPGTPFIVAGSNGTVAWGYTNSYGDWSDPVVLKPGSAPDTYQTPEGDRSFDLYRETIEVKGEEAPGYEIRETIWGPVDDGIDYPDGEIAVSWIAHKPEAVNLRIIDLETVASVTAALDVANAIGMPPQNFVAGDADGNIGWTIAGQIPRRNGFDGMVPADWSHEHGWPGWLAADAYPRVVNPDSGRIWTANARVADAAALAVIGDGGYDLGARASQIRDALQAKAEFSADDMLAIQYDDRALFLSRWRDLMLETLTSARVQDEPELAEFRRLVDEWVPRAAPGSVGYRLVRAFRLEVQSRVFHGLTATVREQMPEGIDPLMSNQFEGALWALLSERPLHLLPGRYASWDDLLVDAARTNIAWFNDNYAGGLADRNWGEFNTAAIRHPMSRALPVLSGLLDMPREPLNGDVDLPKAQGPAFGASERFTVAPGDEANGLMQMPTGQSGHPLSDFYRKGHADWVRGSPSPFLPGPPAHELRLQPGA